MTLGSGALESTVGFLSEPMGGCKVLSQQKHSKEVETDDWLNKAHVHLLRNTPVPVLSLVYLYTILKWVAECNNQHMWTSCGLYSLMDKNGQEYSV